MSPGAAASRRRPAAGRRRPVLAAALALAALVLACGESEPPLREVVFEGPVMGTRYTVKLVVSDVPVEGHLGLADLIENELEAVNSSMSTYLTDSELSRFNRRRDDEPFAFSPPVIEVLERAQEISQRSGGAFDVTVGPLVNAYGFGPGGQPPSLPAADELAELRRHVGWRLLEIDAEAGTARKLDPELYVDLSAVAKGYAVDRVARLLEEEGYEDFMVEVGGEVRTSGLNFERQPWRIGIERPVAETIELQRVVELSGHALATSGDYRNFYVVDGRRLAHTIDPRSGRPVEHRTAAVTVVADDCLSADGWATALMVLGAGEGLELAEREGLAALFLLHAEGERVEEVSTTAFGELAGDSQPAASAI